MHEPPRIEPAASNFQRPLPGVPGHPQPPPRRNTGLLIGLLAVVGLGTILACGGVFYLLIQIGQSSTRVSSQYAAVRETPGGTLPEPLRKSADASLFENSGQLSGAQMNGLTELLDYLAGYEAETAHAVDLARFVLEIEATGTSDITFLTRTAWQDNLEDALELPSIWENYQILDFQWLKEKQEARLMVASGYPSSGDATLYLLYVIRAADGWKLYDWRETLEPMSEVQYWAHYTACPEPQATALYDLTMDLNEILEDETLAEESKPGRSMARLRRADLPTMIVPLAQDYTAFYLKLYPDAEVELQQLSQEMRPEEFAGAHYWKGLAALTAQPDVAFLQAMQIVAKVGWHPMAAQLAMDAANTPEQKLEAVKLASRLLLLGLADYASLSAFFDAASLDAIGRLLDDISRQPSGQERMLDFIDTMPWASPQEKVRLLPLMAATRIGPLASDYYHLQTIHRDAKPQEQQLLFEAASRLAGSAELDADRLQQARSALLQAGNRLGRLDEVKVLLGGPQGFARELRNSILKEAWEDWDWGTVLPALEALDASNDVAEEHLKQVAVGIALAGTQDLDAAWRVLVGELPHRLADLQRLEANAQGAATGYGDAEEEAFQDPMDYGYPLLEKLAEIAVSTNREAELATLCGDTELVYLMLAAKLAEQGEAQRLMQFNAWYASQETPIATWLKFYQVEAETKLNEQAGQADSGLLAEKIVESVDAICQDQRLANYELSAPLYWFAPFEAEPYDLIARLAEMAVRTRTASAVTEGLSHEIQDDYSWSDLIRGALRSSQDAEQLSKLSEQFLATGAPSAQLDGYRLAAQVSLLAGEHQNALATLRQALEVSASSEYMEYPRRACFDLALDLMVATGDYQALELFADLPEAESLSDALPLVRALAGRDAAGFLAAFSGLEPYQRRRWLQEPRCLEAYERAGLLAEINQALPFLLGATPHGSFQAAGAMLLDAPASATQSQIEKAFAAWELEVLDAARFPDAVAAWQAETADGNLCLVAYDGSPPSLNEEHVLGKALGEASGVLCITLLPRVEIFTPNRQLRQYVSEAAEKLEVCGGFWDLSARKYFAGNGWKGILAEYGKNGQQPRKPDFDETYLSTSYWQWPDVAQLEAAVEAGHYPVHLGLATEHIPVQRTTQTPSREWDAAYTQYGEYVEARVVSNGLVKYLQPGGRVMLQLD